MKILYLTVPSFFDLEISLIRELKKRCDIKVLMYMAPVMMRSSSFELQRLDSKCGLINAEDYAGMEKYSSLINLKDWVIINNPTGSYTNYIKLIYRTLKFIRKWSPSLIHSTTEFKGALGLYPFIRNSKRIKLLYTVHDPVPHSKISFIKRLVHWYIYNKFENLLLLSKSETSNYFMKHIAPRKSHILYSSLGVYDYLNTIQSGENTIGDYILFFGRIEHYKGVDLLVKGYKESNCHSNGVNLVIAGKGEINDCEYPGIVKINRYIPNEELASLIKFANVVALPYRTMTQSGVLMSAFAFNKPVIITKVGNVEQLNIEGNYGIVIEPNSIEEIKNGLNYFVDNRTEFEEFSNNIQRDYLGTGNMGWSKIAYDLIDDYKEIIKN